MRGGGYEEEGKREKGGEGECLEGGGGNKKKGG